ncbi:MAG: UbiA family prenyltransferase [Cytophagales bacterium]
MLGIFDKNTIKLLRIPFSFFLMPVFFLVLSQSDIIDQDTVLNAFWVFIIIHLFIYPASNGYNSYQDQDEESIGGIKNPPKATKSLFWASLLLDCIGLGLAYYVGFDFFIGLLIYTSVSRAYSWRKLRLKKYSVLGFFSVVILQGFGIFVTTYAGINQAAIEDIFNSGLMYPAIASSFMIAGIYPITQIYQHKQDVADGVNTLSYRLGYRGTFVFSSIMFAITGVVFYLYFSSLEFLLFQLFLAPVAIFFVRWFVKVWNDANEANFENTMRMNIIASTCMSACFLTIFMLDRLGI